MSDKKDDKEVSVDDEALDSVGSAVGNFAHRIQKELKQREISAQASEQERELRHGRMLKALNTIRRAVNETCRINLGERFELEFDVTDQKGWPRLELMLVDAVFPENQDFGLVVTAHDRQDRGAVEIHLRSGELLGSVELQEEKAIDRLPIVLKKSMRSFLDRTAEVILEKMQAAPTEIESHKPLDVEEEAPDETSQSLLGESLFSDEEEVRRNDNVVSTSASSTMLSDIDFDKVKK